jgi:murein DD-endopeptidase MepM/ murein hydrolase activator NlpD
MDAEPISTWEVPGERLILPSDEELLDSMPEPLRSVDVRPARVLQGRTLTVQVASEDPIRIDGVVGEQALRFVKATDETLVALEGIHAMLEPGLYDLQLNFYEDGDGDPFFSHSQPLRVASGQYGYDPILIVPEETLDPSVTGPENEFIASIVAEVDENRYWEGFFQFPGQYVEAFPSHFGARRNYNNTGYNNYHTGLDFYGGAGSLIYAPASGRVAFAGDLEVRGKVTLIDHGWGVYTGYLHQSEILVREGDRVQVGEVIGKVGGTGRVTGPHLHWEVWVGGQPVDPLEWTSVELP